MTWHDGSHAGVNIFVNKENFAFALPLISLCSIYAYFKYVPLHVGLSIIGTGIVFYKVTSSVKTRAIERKEEKIANLDESLLKELAADEIEKSEREKQKAANKKAKAQTKALQRLAAEKKKAASKKSNNNKKVNDDEEDAQDMATFVQGGKSGKKRN
jgi:hypothetical protein